MPTRRDKQEGFRLRKCEYSSNTYEYGSIRIVNLVLILRFDQHTQLQLVVDRYYALNRRQYLILSKSLRLTLYCSILPHSVRLRPNSAVNFEKYIQDLCIC